MRAVFFDLGGTLFEHLEATTSAANLRHAWRSLLHELPAASVPVDAPDTAAQFISDYRRLRAQRELDLVVSPFYLHRSLVAASFVSAAGVQLASQPDALPLIERHAKRFCDAQQNSVIQELEPRDDMYTTLEALRTMDLILGIVSNIDEDYLVPLAHKHDLETYFRFILSSERAQCCKPAPQIFVQALAEGGDNLQASQVLFVGDSPAHDVAGAKALGMVSCLIDPAASSEEKVLGVADFHIQSLAQLPQLVGSLL